MKARVKCGLVVSALMAAAVLTTPVKSAIAQDCTEQLARDFLAGWSHNLPLFTDNVVYEDTTVPALLHGKDEFRVSLKAGSRRCRT